MVRRRTRKNPSPPPAPPRRRGAGAVDPAKLDRSLSRVRTLSKGLSERDRSFSPERPGSWRGSSRDLVVNRRGRMRKNSYELSFSPEFFFAEGEPYDGGPELPAKRPISVWSAIETMRMTQPEQWAELAKEVFGLDNPEYLTPEAVLEKIQETNTCGTLSSPVDVYIDPEGWFSVDVYDEMRDNKRRHRRNAHQTGFGFGEALELRMPTFDWRQVGGDMSPGAHGGLIARADGDQIDLIEIQPVREYVGDGEAAEVGFPFWTREATYDLADLSLDKDEVKSALQSMDIDHAALEEVSPDQRTLAIAEALMSYGHAVEEGQGGWSKDIVRFPVEWWGGTTATFEDYCGDEDDEFRKDVLNEEWHYVYGSGMRGYLFDNGPHVAESMSDAIDDLVDTFTVGDPSISEEEEKRMRLALAKDGYYEFEKPREIGAEYAEITREDGPMPESDD